MENEKLSVAYWESRYQKGETGWDIGEISTPLLEFFNSLEDKSLRILIPGCGNAYEAAYLHSKGFTHVYLLDFAQSPLQYFQEMNPDFPTAHLLHQDFFEHQGTYDLIVEQTFFCAINPILRKKYVAHISSLLAPYGILVGLLFDCQFEKEGPPFGGNREEYESLFKPYFTIQKLELCRNSISPRSGKELFIKATKL
jgi:methyl halide transferase